MILVKNCSAKRRLLRHSLSFTTSSTFSLLFFIVVFFLSLPSCPVLAFKAGHVEAVPGSTVLRRPSPVAAAAGGGIGTTGASGSNRSNYPPTGGGGSRSAILMKLTSPRREFGGHVYQDPNEPSPPIVTSYGSHQSPITSDLYAFSKSLESQQHDDERAPFVRFPTISSPFSNIQSSETHLHHHSYQPMPIPTRGNGNGADHASTTVSHQQGHHEKPLAQSVSELLAQREEPSSLFGAGGLAPHEDEEDLFDSYYTTGSDDDTPLSSVDIDRYSSQEETVGDLFKKQTATSASPAAKLNASSSGSSSSTTTATASTSADNNSIRHVDTISSRSSSSSDSKSNDNDKPNNSLPPTKPSVSSSPVLSKPTLMPLPANYLSMATFKHIDNTLEKSSSNILSRIANFWRSRTMSSHSNVNGTVVAVNSTSNTKTNNNHDDNHQSSSSISDTNKYTKLASDSSIGADNDDHMNHDNHQEEYDEEEEEGNDNAFVKKSDEVDNIVNRSSNHDRNDNNNDNKDSNQSKNKRRQSESGSSAQATAKYISIEDLDNASTMGATGGGIHSNQYLSLDDDEDHINDDGRVGVGDEDFVTTGGSTKEEEHTAKSTSTTPTKTSSSSKQDDLDDDHFLRHHDHHSSGSVEDYINNSEAATSSQAASDWLLGLDDSSQSSHTFHDDLFHTTTGTITAVIDNSSSSSVGGGSSKTKKDLMGSASSKIERVHKSDSERKASVVVSPSSSSGGGSKGDIKRAESEKIWSSIDSHFGRNDLIESAESEEEHEYYYGMTIGGFLKRELWTIPLFVLASLNMILIILFEVYVLCRARGTSRRHLFLGQMLLFGLFLCSFLALMFAVHPSIVGCFVGRLGVGITYSLIFSVLMVKCVFLLSLDTGVYLPTSYQGILLFFAVAVQVAVDTQWVIMYPPFLQTVESGRSLLLQCGTSFVQLLYSLSYVGFLILMVGFLAGRAAYKGVVENYREAVYILITAVVTVPVALSWTVAGWMLQGRHQDACVSFGLVAHSLTTFLIMFMPKGRQLASLDKEAVCFEDQEDQCSGYSPSFFHFKPTTKNYKTALWGDGNLYTTLEPTVSTINPNVFFHRNDFHSGMIY